ncbi:MAG: peptide chain release factor N(5)-glutamine methyltransferase [Gammaproteobacteria bacterium]
MPSPTLADALCNAVAQLAPLHGSARLDAELLLAAALEQPRSYLYAWPERALTATQSQRFNAFVARRAAGEPIAHLLGRREFWSLALEVTPDTLIPRPETELLVESALARIPGAAHWHIADLGTGSGAVALALGHERPRCRVDASDLSAAALAVAERNARRLDLHNLGFHLGAWYAAFAGQRFDVIVSNPPYVRADDPHLNEGDARFDPRCALVAGHDGLGDLRQIIAGAPGHLLPGGWLLVEHGYDQGPAVAELFTQAGFLAVHTHPDLAGHPRVTEGQRALSSASA